MFFRLITITLIIFFAKSSVFAAIDLGNNVQYIPNTTNLGIGFSNPLAKLAVNGAVMIKDGTQGASKVLTSDASGNATWQTATLGGYAATDFLKSNGSDSYTAGTLTFDAGTTVDINSTTLQIADTNITFDGASTTFTSTGAMSLVSGSTIGITPAAGSNLNVSLSGAGDFAVNTNQLYVDTSNGNIGIGTTSPSSNLHIANATNPEIRINDTTQAGSYLQLKESTDNQAQINKIVDTGNATLDFNAIPQDNVSNAQIRLNRTTDTNGLVFVAMYRGNNSATIDHYFESGTSASSYLAANGGKIGIGTTNPGAELQVNGDIIVTETLAFDEEYDNSTSGAAKTIDWNNGNRQTVQLTANTTLTFTAPIGTTNVLIRLVQDGTGSWTVTWPTSVKWPSGTAPTLTTTASGEDIVSCYYNETNYYCQASLDFQ